MAVFTDAQIAEILALINQQHGHTKYIGARYVPIFGRKNETSIDWDNSAPYEPLTIVTYQGDSYTSRQYVPAGIDINNTDFWALTGNYNAQIELYRNEVSAVADDVNDLKPTEPDAFPDNTNNGFSFMCDTDNGVKNMPLASLDYGDGSSSMFNPLPIIQAACSYFSANCGEELRYGGLGILRYNGDTELTPATPHQINCSTLGLAAALGIDYGSSMYSGANVSTIRSECLLPYGSAYKSYMPHYDDEEAGERTFTFALAKYLMQRGELMRITSISALCPGMLVFMDNETSPESEIPDSDRLLGIDHCAIVIDVLGSNLIIFHAGNTLSGQFHNCRYEVIQGSNIVAAYMPPTRQCGVYRWHRNNYYHKYTYEVGGSSPHLIAQDFTSLQYPKICTVGPFLNSAGAGVAINANNFSTSGTLPTGYYPSGDSANRTHQIHMPVSSNDATKYKYNPLYTSIPARGTFSFIIPPNSTCVVDLISPPSTLTTVDVTISDNWYRQ